MNNFEDRNALIFMGKMELTRRKGSASVCTPRPGSAHCYWEHLHGGPPMAIAKTLRMSDCFFKTKKFASANVLGAKWKGDLD